MTRKPLFIVILVVGIFLFAGFLFLFVGVAPRAESITWGVNFSVKAAEYLELDWKETYLALLQDLEAKNIKVAAHWDFLEPADQEFFFEDLDWQMNRAQEYGAKVLLAIGIKTPRWPECHIPSWAGDLSKEKLQQKVLDMLSAVVSRYKDHPALSGWQVENEPLFPFGKCPWRDLAFLQKEVTLVRSLDPGHDVFTSDSGELSLWMNMARLGDKVAVTMYQKAWMAPGVYFDYPFPPVFYYRKSQLVERIFGKEVIVGELQAEPWTPRGVMQDTLEEQAKSMDAARFKSNIEFAKQTGLGAFYLWGGEWWYWLKTKHNDFRIWNEAKNLFQNEDNI
ncbi:MAG: hypothetical protein HYU04_01680 [Candidatus Wildermuthbacteria bacterium]|nr:hypothetical protein [Candidatus Wildermuthbacteria bacterium]